MESYHQRSTLEILHSQWYSQIHRYSSASNRQVQLYKASLHWLYPLRRQKAGKLSKVFHNLYYKKVKDNLKAPKFAVGERVRLAVKKDKFEKRTSLIGVIRYIPSRKFSIQSRVLSLSKTNEARDTKEHSTSRNYKLIATNVSELKKNHQVVLRKVNAMV